MPLTINDLDAIVAEILLFFETQNIQTLEGISERCGKNYSIEGSKRKIFVDERSGYLGLYFLSLTYHHPEYGTVLEIQFNKTYNYCRIYAIAPTLLNRSTPIGPEQPAGIPQMTTSGCSIQSAKRALETMIHKHDRITDQHRIPGETNQEGKNNEDSQKVNSASRRFKSRQIDLSEE